MAKGYADTGDLITVTADGVSLDKLWDDYQQLLQTANDARSAIQNLLCFPTILPGEAVPQTIGRDDFQLASEYGEPTGVRIAPDVLRLGYDFQDYDLATRFTWKFLRDAPASQVDMAANLVLDSDYRLQFRQVMRALMNNSNRTNPESLAVFAAWNGDGTVSTPFQANTFDSSHSHYFTTGAANIDSGDVDALLSKVQEHGYGPDSGQQYVLFANPAQTAAIRSWRAGVVNANSAVATADYVPAADSPVYLSNQQIIGEPVANSFSGQRIIGSYGPVLIAETGFFPAGYLLLVASGGANSPYNPVGFREHANAAYRGLKLYPGMRQGYPLVNSFFSRSFGCGVRHRGAAAVSQITASGTYAVPAEYLV